MCAQSISILPLILSPNLTFKACSKVNYFLDVILFLVHNSRTAYQPLVVVRDFVEAGCYPISPFVLTARINFNPIR